MQPPLNGSAVVSGDPATLIRVVLQGPAQVLPTDRAKYANQMPPFGVVLSDDDIATVLTLVRRQFGKGGAPVTPSRLKRKDDERQSG